MSLALLTVILGALATARLTRLVAADRVTQPLRTAVATRFGPSHGLAYLIHCRWCVSMYLAPPVAALVLWLWDALAYDLADVTWPARIALGALLALAYSHLTALLAGLEDED